MFVGEGICVVVINFVEQNVVVMVFIEGVEFDENGVIEVLFLLFGNCFIFYVVICYCGNLEKWQIGVVLVMVVEFDQQICGEVEGIVVMFIWQEDELFNGVLFWQWGFVIFGFVLVIGVIVGMFGLFMFVGVVVLVMFVVLQVFGVFGEMIVWMMGQYVVFGDVLQVYWDGDSWVVGVVV